MEKSKNRKQIGALLVLCVSIVAISVSLTYGYFVSQATIEEEQLTIKSGTLALTFSDNSDTIQNIEGTWNFGDSIEKEFIIENTGTLDAYAKISWENLVNTYLVKSLTYKLEEKTDESGSTYQTVYTTRKNVPQSETTSKQELANGLLIPAGSTYTYKLTVTLEDLEDIDQTPDINAKFITKFTLDEGTELIPSLALYYATVEKKTANPIFENAATTDETADGLYGMIDDSGEMSYYFRGAVENNYVKFGKNASGEDMYWRIIRFNGNGTVRMQYDGTRAWANGANNSNRVAIESLLISEIYDDAKYVGYMFGGANGAVSTSKEEAQANETSSNVKVELEAWYKVNILNTGYHDYIADEIFCNDRSTPGPKESGLLYDSGLGYGKNKTAYGAYTRIGDNSAHAVTPQFTCSQDNDKFTVSTSSGGNGALTYPVGLITVDEIAAAGSGRYFELNYSYYLYKGPRYLSFSPAYFNISSTVTYCIQNYLSIVNGGNYLSIVPVINIKAEYLDRFIGEGTMENPYHFE